MKINYSNPKKFAMGLAIGNAIGIPFGGASQSWEDYWKSQTEVLFFGLYSEISGGQMPNKKTGSSDYLTVAGAAGSETYQCPNTAPYIAADTDYIWFNVDGTQRTVKTIELTKYDLQRTPVKYEDASPNEIVAIIILNAAVTGTKRDYLFRDMWLPILWDNNLNGYGHIKDNRIAYNPSGGSIISSADTWGWYDWEELSTLTKDAETGVTTAWADRNGRGNNLAGAGSTWDAITGITFDGTNDYLRKNATLNQPTYIYAVLKQITWTANDRIWDGWALNSGALVQINVSPVLAVFAPDFAMGHPVESLSNYLIIQLILNHENSKLIINDVERTGDPGDNNMGGITLGCRGGLGSQFGNFAIKELIIRTAETSSINTYLKSRHNG